jgi:hypothetical protein
METNFFLIENYTHQKVISSISIQPAIKKNSFKKIREKNAVGGNLCGKHNNFLN